MEMTYQNDEQNEYSASVIEAASAIIENTTSGENDRYNKAYNLFNQVRTHSDSTYFPAMLFREKAPNETAEEFNYRKSIYRSATYHAWTKIEGAFRRIMNEQNYTITIPEETDKLVGRDEKIGEYLFFNYPEYESVTTYFKTVVFSNMLSDPNALFVILPNAEIEAEEVSAIRDSRGHIYECWRVFGFKEDNYALICLNEEGEIPNKATKNTSKKLLSFLWIDRENYVKLRQVQDKKGLKKLIVTDIIPHGKEDLPARNLRGKMKRANNGIVYESYIYPAVPTLDRATCDQSTLDISKYSHAFLQRWEYVTECTHRGCVDGKVPVTDQDGKLLGTGTCPSCNGEGTKRMLGAMQSYQVQVPSREGDPKPQLPPAGYVDLDHSILEFLAKEIDRNIEKSFQMLNIDISNSEVHGGETALGKQIDREELFSFMQEMSENMFSMMEWALNLIMELRYGQLQEGKIAVSRPTNFELRSAGSLINEMKEAQSPINKYVIGEYADIRFGKMSRQRDVVKLALAVDAFFGYEASVVQSLVSSNTMPKWMATLHFDFTSILDDVVARYPELMEMPIQDIKKLLNEEAQLRTVTSAPPQGSFDLQDILGVANA